MKHCLIARHALLATGLAAACHLASAQGHAHEHGVVKLDVAIDATRVTVLLSSPLDNLLGFEHAARTEPEQQKVAVMADRLRAAERLFVIDPAAGCTLGAVQLKAPVLGLQVNTASPALANALPPGHGDLDAEFEFNCAQATKARSLTVNLWNPFSSMRRIEAQVATPTWQGKQTLSRPATQLKLAP